MLERTTVVVLLYERTGLMLVNCSLSSLSITCKVHDRLFRFVYHVFRHTMFSWLSNGQTWLPTFRRLCLMYVQTQLPVHALQVYSILLLIVLENKKPKSSVLCFPELHVQNLGYMYMYQIFGEQYLTLSSLI